MFLPKNHAAWTAVLVFTLFALAITGCGSAPSNLTSPASESTASGTEGPESGTAGKANETDSTNTNEASSGTEQTTEQPSPTVEIKSSDQAWTLKLVVNDVYSDASSWEVRWRKERDSSWTDWFNQAYIPDDQPSLKHTVTGLENGYTYEIQVRLKFNSGITGPATQASATPFTTPEAVQGLDVQSANERLEVSFEKPSSNGGSPITAYRYWYRESGEVNWSTPSETTELRVTIGDLTNRTDYDVKVVALNASGEGKAAESSGTPDWSTVMAAPDEVNHDGLGWGLAADGDQLVVTHDPDTGNNRITFYVTDGTSLTPSRSFTSRELGQNVAVDGDIAAVTTWFRNSNDFGNGNWKKRVRTFTYDGEGENWNDDARISLEWDDADALANYEDYALALQDDRLVVASRFGSQNTQEQQIGAVQVFERTQEGSWNSLSQQITDPRANPNAWFGHAVGIHGDTLVVGAPNDGSFSATVMGEVYVYQRQQNGSWSLTKTLQGENHRHRFGASVALTHARLVVGAPEGNRVYVYERDSETGVIPQNATRILQKPQDAQGNGFGRSVTTSENLLAVGVTNATGNGTVYLFEHVNEEWQRAGELVGDLAADDADAGRNVVLTGNRLYVSAQFQPHDDSREGAVFMFDDVSNRYQAP